MKGLVASSLVWWLEIRRFIPFTPRQDRRPQQLFILLCIHECIINILWYPFKWALLTSLTVNWVLLIPWGEQMDFQITLRSGHGKRGGKCPSQSQQREHLWKKLASWRSGDIETKSEKGLQDLAIWKLLIS